MTEITQRIAVIMTVHNRREMTLKSLAALYAESNMFDVYLTDDGSTDGTKEAVMQRFPQVNIIEGDGNLFWNRGMHAAFGVALEKGYDYYLWLNDDTYLVPGFLDNLLECSASESNRSIICGACINNQQEKTFTYGGYTKNSKPLDISDKKQVAFFASGNIYMIPKAVSDKLGNLDYYYHHSLGDFDYGGRASISGIRVIQAPNYCGICARHDRIPKWRDINVGVIDRLKSLYSITGQPPKETFYFNQKIFGLPKACYRVFLIHLRCLFPFIWHSKYSVKE